MLLRGTLFLWLWRYVRPLLPISFTVVLICFLVVHIHGDIVGYANQVGDETLLKQAYRVKWLFFCLTLAVGLSVAGRKLSLGGASQSGLVDYNSLNKTDRALVDNPVLRSQGDVTIERARVKKSVEINTLKGD